MAADIGAASPLGTARWLASTRPVRARTLPARTNWNRSPAPVLFLLDEQYTMGIWMEQLAELAYEPDDSPSGVTVVCIARRLLVTRS